MSSSKTTEEAQGHLGHVVPMRVLLGTWGALVALTVLTVAATYIDLGNLNIVIALAIAVAKSALVVLFFMHLRYDKPFHAIVFVSAALFVMLFISLALMDTKEYAGSKIPGYAPEIELARQERAGAEESAGAAEDAADDGAAADGAMETTETDARGGAGEGSMDSGAAEGAAGH
jgi:cytochrome c oxidase subunit 4